MLNIIAIIRVGWEWGTLSISLIKVSCLFTSPLGKHHPYCPVYSMITCRFLTPFLFTHCLSCYSYILVCGFLSMRNILSYSLHSYYICLFRTKYIATHHILCSNAISNFVSLYGKFSSSICCIRPNINKYLHNLNVFSCELLLVTSLWIFSICYTCYTSLHHFFKLGNFTSVLNKQ